MAEIRAGLADSRFRGEGYRKIRAQLQHNGNPELKGADAVPDAK